MSDTTKPECNSQFNLEHFLNGLTLQPMVLGKRAPPMPPPNGRSTMTPLVMRPGGYRKLEVIKALDCLNEEATFFFNNLNGSIGNGEVFTNMKLSSQVSATQVENMLLSNPYEVEANSAALFVIERGPIKSVQQLVHTINPELQDLAFFTPARSGTLNAQKVDPMFFCAVDESGGMESVKCIVVALPPWDFSPQDFQDFATMNSFDEVGCTSMNGMANEPPWCNADRMWAYLHDLCFIHDCHHFVLTSYQQWAFGAFSAYYTTGFVSRTTPWNAKPTSVLELFTYWILDACRTENTIMMEQVPQEKHFDCDIFEQERRLYRERFGNGEHLGSGPIPIIPEAGSFKRKRKDPLEVRTGWEPLNQHVDALFLSPRRLRPSKSIPRRINSEHGNDSEGSGDGLSLAKPCPEWNRWYKLECDPADKENPSPSSGEPTRTEKTVDPTPKTVTHSRFGHPTLCYSLDVDRDNNCFRPDLLGLISFPIPKP